MAKWRIPAVLSVLALALTAVPFAAPARAADTSLAVDYTNVNGTLDTGKVLNGSQGGYWAIGNPTWFNDQIPELKRQGVREVRIGHLLNDRYYHPVTRDASGQLRYDWSRLDRAILPLLDAGIEPYMLLSFMPGALAANEMDPPNDYAEWGATVRALVEHYVQLGHTGLTWEVWNEPDLAGFWTGTPEQFNQLYQVSVEAVRAADPTAKVGGGGFAHLDTPLTVAFLDWYAQNTSVPMDFFSWHHYDPLDFSDTATAREMLSSRGIPEKELHLNEWNITPNMTGGPGAGSDSNGTAAYAARRMSTAFDTPGLTKTYWFSPMEGLTPSLVFNGDLGAITANGHRKAAGNVFEMYDEMAPERLDVVGGLDDRSLSGLASRDQEADRVTILMWNHSDAAATVDVDVSNLPYGDQEFRVVRTVVDETNGNYFHDWSNGNVGQRPGPHEYPGIARNDVLDPSESFAETVAMAPNSVTQLVLTPATEPPPSWPKPVDNLAAGQPAAAGSSYDGQGWGAGQLTDTMRHTILRTDNGEPTAGYSSLGHPEAAHTEWVRVDLGSPQPFDRVGLWPRDDLAAEGAGFPADFTIEGANSPDGPWATLHTETDYNAGEPVRGVREFAVPDAEYQYVRVHATELGVPVTEAGTPTYRLQLAELEVD